MSGASPRVTGVRNRASQWMFSEVRRGIVAPGLGTLLAFVALTLFFVCTDVRPSGAA